MQLNMISELIIFMSHFALTGLYLSKNCSLEWEYLFSPIAFLGPEKALNIVNVCQGQIFKIESYIY